MGEISGHHLYPDSGHMGAFDGLTVKRRQLRGDSGQNNPKRDNVELMRLAV
ncbi:hypothetical protein [Paraglaciecola psychrophila]|uniref:hypothetical protein n=1 Tax=Paraglaciecola psychrophila TaxID=326544 RepID=UPI001F4686F4|nr:hypothetical protein [Paraglaciecola psychrophila]